MRGDVPIELAIERPADRSHRRQGEQLSAGQGNVGRSGRPHHPPQRQPSAIEFAQASGIGDRGAALERRALDGACRQGSVKQNENANEKSHCPAFSQRMPRVLRTASFNQENSRKADKLSRGNPEAA
jgi:hypothetical protein